MARLLMLSGKINSSSTPVNVTHPRTGKQIRKFGVRKIILWNDNGTVGGAINGFNLSEAIGTYGVIELHDMYEAAGGPDASISNDDKLVMRFPVSGKSRMAFEVPGNGFVFKDGILVRLGTDESSNSSANIYFQLVGYEYKV